MVELTRRDALAALAAGAGATAGCLGLPESTVEDATVPTLVAAAEVVFPTAVEGHREFVETYVAGRIDGRPAYREGVERAAEDLDSLARAWHDGPFEALSADAREDVLRSSGADTADPDPAGSRAERIRYYVVNELLYALFTSPTGGTLVGTENPVGYPGGTGSYQRGPQS